MKMRQFSLCLVLLFALVVVGRGQTTESPTEARPRTVAQSQLPATPVVSSVKLAENQEPTPLHLLSGRSLVVTSPQLLKRVSVSDPAIASAIIVNPNQVLINGLAPGRATLLLWNEREQSTAYDLQIDLDISGLRETLAQVFPNDNIQVSQSASAIVLTGNVLSKDAADRANALALTYSKSVINMLNIQQITGGNEILLQVRFAEVDRSAVQQLGINFFSTGIGNSPGAVSTGQFSPPSVTGQVTGQIPGQLPGFSSSFALSDLLNVFIFRPDLNLGATIRALQQRSVLQILAEPNLLALNGREASFLAGGEFPFPVVQTGSGLNAVTIVFKEFGVRLKFTPNILSDGTIRLKVAPEVSSLDFTNALTISGFLIPALSTRRADTEIELRDGQSFAIAGLLDNRVTTIGTKIPALGDIPIIGKFFRSRSQNKSNTELLVMVTPKIVKPLPPGQVPNMPSFPQPFLDKDKFDGKKGETTTKKNN